MNGQRDQERFQRVAEQIREQLSFYELIGITDIGGAQRPRDHADEQPVSEPPVATPGEERPAEAGVPEAPSAVFEQATLFGVADPASAPVRRPVRAPGLLPVKPDASLEDIRTDIGDCRRCKLCEQRSNIVFGEGDPNADLMFIGEGPGADEDATGRPFVGRAGQLLDKIIAAIGMRREETYIANVVKCRPPGNRTPERDEVSTCEQFLYRQIAVIRPRVIVTLGSPAFQCVLRSRDSVTKIRGEWRDLEGIAVMPTFHPAYLLRSPDKKREVWEDMKKVRKRLDDLERKP
ncbi:MAG TPA: uracil-DNA glycosylase [Blastocatellia bacterium]|nr:uracil-DNA glycosylase [Blastocatellia bacterium]